MLVGDIVRRNADHFGDRDALVEPGVASISWSALEQRTNRLARGLLRLGLRAGERIAMFSPNATDYVTFFFGCAKTGIIGSPLNVRLMPGELATYLRYVEPRAIVVHASLESQADLFVPDVPSIIHRIGFGGAHGMALDLEDLLNAQEPTDPGCRVDAEAVYQLCPTSGTTGRVKAAVLTQRNAVSAIMSWLAEFPIHEADTHLQSIAFFFNSGGPAAGIHPVFVKGGRTVVDPGGFEPLRFMRLVQRYGVAHTTMVPTMMRMVLDHPERADHGLSTLRSIVFGGMPVSGPMVEEIRASIGPVVYPVYAMAETYSSGIILRQEHLPAVGGSGLLPAGRPQAGMNARAVDAHGCDVPRDGSTPGEVWLRGENVSPGYFRLDEETADSHSADWLKTGDVATVDAQGFFTIVDRAKDIIITGGINVVSREVEEALLAHEAVSEVAVIGVPHAQWGEAIHAVVVLHPGAEVSSRVLLDFAAGRLAGYKRPLSTEFVDELPRTATGKVLKRDLRRARAADGLAGMGL